MAGIGSFDQTGSLSDAFKRGALTYGGGQLARFAGGAGFQGNPFTSGGAFTPSGFTAGFSSPLGTDTGIGKLLNDRRQQAIGKQIAEQGQLNREVANIGQIADAGGLDPGTIVDPSVISETVTKTATESAPKSVIQAIKNQDYFEAAKLAAEKGTKALFLDKDGNLDKTMVLAAGTAGLTYLDAKKLADELGEDIGTEEEYDEATKAEKKAEYAGYLTNFFEGKKDGGRIGFTDGGEDLSEDPNYKGWLKLYEMNPDAAEQNENHAKYLSFYKRTKEAQGGRIGYMFGDKVEDSEGIMSMSEDEEDENMKMAYFPGDVFSKAEISRLFRDKSLTTNQDRKQLFRILMNPGMFPEAEKMLKKMLRGKQDGGRIGYGSGSRPSQLFKLLEEAEAAGDMDKVKEIKSDLFREFGLKLAKGGRINYNMGSEVPVRKNKAGIEELDYRESGGFVPVGVKEKADDVPAMLSKNEFVLTADAVRGIGGGDVEKGAEKLYGVMKQAEKVGRA